MLLVGEVVAKFSADTTSFHRGVQQAQRDLSVLAQHAEKSGGSLRRAFEFAGGQAIFQAMEVGARRMIQFGKEATEAAARVGELDKVLMILARNAGVANSIVDAQVAGIQKQGITAEQSRDTMASFLRFQMDAKKASELARVAQDAAVLAGEDSSATLERLMWGIQTRQTETLRTAGIMVNFEQANQTFAQSIGKTTATLTEQEKVQSALNAVLKEGVSIEGSYEASMENAGKQLRSTKRYVNDLMVAIGESSQPAYAAYAFGLNSIIKETTKIFDPDGPISEMLKSFSNAAALDIRMTLAKVIHWMQGIDWDKAAAGIKQVFSAFKEAIPFLAAAGAELLSTLGLFGGIPAIIVRMGAFALASKDVRSSLGDLAGQAATLGGQLMVGLAPAFIAINDALAMAMPAIVDAIAAFAQPEVIVAIASMATAMASIVTALAPLIKLIAQFVELLANLHIMSVVLVGAIVMLARNKLMLAAASISSSTAMAKEAASTGANTAAVSANTKAWLTNAMARGKAASTINWGGQLTGPPPSAQPKNPGMTGSGILTSALIGGSIGMSVAGSRAAKAQREAGETMSGFFGGTSTFEGPEDLVTRWNQAAPQVNQRTDEVRANSGFGDFMDDMTKLRPDDAMEVVGNRERSNAWAKELEAMSAEAHTTLTDFASEFHSAANDLANSADVSLSHLANVLGINEQEVASTVGMLPFQLKQVDDAVSEFMRSQEGWTKGYTNFSEIIGESFDLKDPGKSMEDQLTRLTSMQSSFYGDLTELQSLGGDQTMIQDLLKAGPEKMSGPLGGMLANLRGMDEQAAEEYIQSLQDSAAAIQTQQQNVLQTLALQMLSGSQSFEIDSPEAVQEAVTSYKELETQIAQSDAALRGLFDIDLGSVEGAGGFEDFVGKQLAVLNDPNVTEAAANSAAAQVQAYGSSFMAGLEGKDAESVQSIMDIVNAMASTNPSFAALGLQLGVSTGSAVAAGILSRTGETASALQVMIRTLDEQAGQAAADAAALRAGTEGGGWLEQVAGNLGGQRLDQDAAAFAAAAAQRQEELTALQRSGLEDQLDMTNERRAAAEGLQARLSELNHQGLTDEVNKGTAAKQTAAKQIDAMDALGQAYDKIFGKIGNLISAQTDYERSTLELASSIGAAIYASNDQGEAMRVVRDNTAAAVEAIKTQAFAMAEAGEIGRDQASVNAQIATGIDGLRSKLPALVKMWQEHAENMAAAEYVTNQLNQTWGKLANTITAAQGAGAAADDLMATLFGEAHSTDPLVTRDKSLRAVTSSTLSAVSAIQEEAMALAAAGKIGKDVGSIQAYIASRMAELRSEVAGMTEGFLDQSGSLETLEDALGRVTAEYEKYLGKVMSGNQAHADTVRAIKDMRDVYQENVGLLSNVRLTEEDRLILTADTDAALNDVVRSIIDEGQALAKNGKMGADAESQHAFLLERLKDLKKEFPELAGTIDLYTGTVRSIPDAAKTNAVFLKDEAMALIDSYTGSLLDIPDPSSTAHLSIAEAMSVLDRFRIALGSIPDEVVKISMPAVDTSAAQGSIRSFMSESFKEAGEYEQAIAAILEGRKIGFTPTTYMEGARPMTAHVLPDNPTGHAIYDMVGGEHKFAEGGIAQIARGGPIRVWNEPETHGEAYIPLAIGKRARSTSILEQVAGMFGMELQPFAEGGVTGSMANAFKRHGNEAFGKNALAAVKAAEEASIKNLMKINTEGLKGKIDGSAVTGLDPNFLKLYNIWNEAMGGGFGILSGWRSNAEQAVLYAEHLAGTRPWPVAPPGSSPHNFGMAIDLTRDASPEQRAGAIAYGLHFPVVGEAWHIEPLFYRGGTPTVWENGGINIPRGTPIKSYDQGGVLEPGYTLAFNGTGADELVGGTPGGTTIIEKMVVQAAEPPREFFEEGLFRVLEGSGL